MCTPSIEQIWQDMDSLLPQEPVAEVPETNIEGMCPRCKSFDTNCGVCYSCGLTLDYIDSTAEWKSGVSETGVSSDPSRVGMASDPLYSSKWGSGTIMKVSYTEKKKWGTTGKINFHDSMNHRDRALYKAYQDLEIIGIKLGLSANVLGHAKFLYKKLSETTLTRGKVRTGVKANCIFAACRHFNVPRTTDEVSHAFGIKTTDISRTSCKMEIFDKKQEYTEPADLVPRLFNNINIGLKPKEMSSIKMRSIKRCRDIEECEELMGKTPIAVATVVVYMVFSENGHVIDRASYLADQDNISPATFNKIYNIIKKIGD